MSSVSELTSKTLIQFDVGSAMSCPVRLTEKQITEPWEHYVSRFSIYIIPTNDILSHLKSDCLRSEMTISRNLSG